MNRQPFYCCRFYVTHDCVSHCGFCDTHDPIYRDCLPMPLDKAKNIIRQARDCGCRYIDFTGGEPTLNHNLPELIKYAKSLGIKTEVTTCGAQGVTDVTRKCAELSDKFNVSLDTLSPEVYLELRGLRDRGLENTLKVIEETAAIRRAAGLASVKLMTVVTPANRAELPELLEFAKGKGVEIYMNPVFSYFEGQVAGAEANGNAASLLERYTFHRYAVIMLHFMEFYRSTAEGDYRPPCSANRQTLTFAADGSLLLPCYHARERHSIPIGDDLKECLQQKSFRKYGFAKLKQCENCMVTPYFGISFSFRLDKYFLLASFSEKLVHLKRDYLNMFDLDIRETALLERLEELKRIVRSLDPGPYPEDGALYWAEMSEKGYTVPVYRDPISEAQYEKDMTAPDCWALERVPHRAFDSMSEECFPLIAKWLYEEPGNTDLRGVLSEAQECMVRHWCYYISKWFRVSICCDLEENERWLEAYSERIRRCFSEHGCKEPYTLK